MYMYMYIYMYIDWLVREDFELNCIPSPQERIRSAQLETSIKKTDELLYQMIPKSIADKLRNGQPPLDTCQEFDSVSILFSDIVSFTPMCSRLQPMEVVCVLNKMCTAYDKLCEIHKVYKVLYLHVHVQCTCMYSCVHVSDTVCYAQLCVGSSVRLYAGICGTQKHVYIHVYTCTCTYMYVLLASACTKSGFGLSSDTWCTYMYIHPCIHIL